MILKTDDYNFTLIHYSLLDNPIRMVKQCFKLFKEHYTNYVRSVILHEDKERNLRQSTARGRATRPRSQRTGTRRSLNYHSNCNIL